MGITATTFPYASRPWTKDHHTCMYGAPWNFKISEIVISKPGKPADITESYKINALLNVKKQSTIQHDLIYMCIRINPNQQHSIDPDFKTSEQNYKGLPQLSTI